VTGGNAGKKTVSLRILLALLGPPREGLHIPGLHILLGDAAIDQLGSHSASWHIIPIEESGRPSIRKANLEAPHFGTASCLIEKLDVGYILQV
jgi:hypothetical protein